MTKTNHLLMYLFSLWNVIICSLYILTYILFIFSRQKNGAEPEPDLAHVFQEYTYKKITPCDICSQILRGKYQYQSG